MTARDPEALVRRMQECFNTRQFDQADDLFTPDFFSHPLGTTGFAAGKRAWRTLVTHFPDYRVVAEDVLVDHDRVAIRSSVQGIPTAGPQPVLIEVFRVANGRLAEAWGVGQGLPHDVLRTTATSDDPLTP
ncbi:MAG: SnoaL-like domain-containing protein [Saccharothrix sp.]|nr:SnoaL-like domain-containing protein [Saccharothrix sp.]